MGNGYMASNALGVGCRAEGELIGLALRYELVRGVRLNWRKDRGQTLKAVSESMNDRDGELRSPRGGSGIRCQLVSDRRSTRRCPRRKGHRCLLQ